MDMQTNADVLLNRLLYWETFLWISSFSKRRPSVAICLLLL